MSSAEVSLLITGWPSKRPRTSGRTPYGSRKPTRASPERTAAEKAPRILLTAVRTAPSRSPWASWAMSAVMTSVSVVPENLTPCATSSSRSSVVLTRLPLWPRAMTSPLRERTSGCEFCQWDEPGRRVAHVADGVLAGEAREHALVEDLRDEAQVLDHGDLALVRDRDAGALLAAVLQGVEAEVGEAGDVVPGGEDAEDATGVADMHVVRQVGRAMTRRRRRARSPGPRTARSPAWYTAGARRSRRPGAGAGRRRAAPRAPRRRSGRP